MQYKSDVGTINHNGTGWPGPHAITSVGGDNYAYDVNGNLLFDGENTYTWTIRNELESVTNAGGTKIYTYDAFGRRAKSVFTPVATPENPAPSPQTTIYVSDFMEVREDGPVYYVNAGGERIASYTLYEGGTWRYYHSDHLSGTTLTTDEAGEVVQVLDYEPYGEQTLSLDYGTQGSPYSYTGKELDPSSNLYYYEARWYNPETGHFISTDPFPRRNPAYMIPDPATWNEYSYARGNPIAYTDPTGEWAKNVWRMIANGLDAIGYNISAMFLHISIQGRIKNSGGIQRFYSNSSVAKEIRKSDEYKVILKKIENRIDQGQLSGSINQDGLGFKSGDLSTALGKVGGSWSAKENGDGSYIIDFQITDVYDFSLLEAGEDTNYSSTTIVEANNEAHTDQEDGTLTKYKIEVNVKENYTPSNAASSQEK